ncbi:MAG: tRNA 2-thiocytidine biosynthesis protein TtcA [Clostridiales bacterium]|nr:tRNA 2-thiocytidine biosynthesis protein TtcA [Clostridiales bacterium]
MQKLMSVMRSAMEKYNMIQPGDRIAVGVSGGKDSVTLLAALCEMRRYYPVPYDLEAVTLDMGFGGAGYGELRELCRRLRVRYTVKETGIGPLIFETRKEENPCSLCARMRRGALHDTAKALSCNKIALGHHMDDAVETFYLNLFNGGRIGCFQPVTYLSRKDLTMIRPMALAFERDVIRASRKRRLPVVKSACPADGVTDRQKVKELIRTLEKDYDRLRVKTLGALQRAGVDGW